MDFWLALAGGAAAGAFISGIFGFVKNSQDRVNEHAQWLRNEKMEAYTALLRQAHTAIREVDAARYELPAPDNKLDDIKDVTNARLTIVGASQVRSNATWHLGNLQQAFQATGLEDYETLQPTLKLSEARLEEAIRKDLDVVEREARRHSLRAWFFKHLVDPWRDPLYFRYYRRHGHAWAHR